MTRFFLLILTPLAFISASAQVRAQAATVYSDRDAFLQAACADVLSIPHIGTPIAGGSSAQASIGPLTLSLGSPSTKLYVGDNTSIAPDWLPVNTVSMSGSENLNVDLASPVTAFGFDFAEPTAIGAGGCGANSCPDSVFELSYSNAGVPLGSFQFNVADDNIEFVGFVASAFFDRVEIREIVGGIDNEYWAAFYVPPSPTSYCTTKLDTAGCAPQIAGSGTPSATSANPFDVTAMDVQNLKPGLMFYGFAQAALPWNGGTLCVFPPLRRTSIQFSGGSPSGSDCTGTFSFDFNNWLQSGLDPALTVGTDVYAQYWYRDPADGFGSGLSNALSFELCP